MQTLNFHHDRFKIAVYNQQCEKSVESAQVLKIERENKPQSEQKIQHYLPHTQLLHILDCQ